MKLSKQEQVENRKKFAYLKTWCEQKGGAYRRPSMVTISKTANGRFLLSVGYGNSKDPNHLREMAVCLMSTTLDTKTELDRAYNIIKKYLTAED